MILIVTNRQDQTADFLILELKSRRSDYVRFNTEDFPRRVLITWKIRDGLVDGYLDFSNRQIQFNEITSIWYRRPVSPIPASEITDKQAQDFVVEESRTSLDGLWRTLTCFWISNPDNIRAAENKLYQLKIAAQVGFDVWLTVVTNDAVSACDFYQECKGDVIYKPLQKGRLVRGAEQSFIFTNFIEPDALGDFKNIKYASCLLQKYIHKGAELRVTVFGERVFAVSIESQKTPDAIHDWRRAQIDLVHRAIKLPIDVEERCRNIVKKLGLEFGALDLIVTPDNEYVFVEINPNGQWAWIQQLCPEIPMRETLADLLINGHSFGG
ncbi:MAG: MvdC/MvdD family ATP grasp protein [Dehalococcoidia bacterium]|jgi:glutathione synthase/RimK-type ligase-like ATP-grasp enzyme